MHKFKNASGKYAISNVSCRWFGYLLLHYKFGAWDSLCSIDVSLANISSILKLLTFSTKPAKSASMMKMLLRLLLNILLGPQKDSDLVLENLALRQQLAILKRHKKRPQIRTKDRLFWIMLCRFWSNWREALVIVKPDTVVRWHKKGFKIFWRFKSRQKGSGRPPVSPEIRDLILKMAAANPLWGAPRIHGELLKLGIKISERTVSNLMHRRVPKPPSQTWRTFLKNHMTSMVSIDLWTREGHSL